MSVHPSLKIDSAGAQQRTVLTRIERIKDLMKKGLWSDDHAVVGLPKTKIVRVKAQKKTKEEKPEGEAAQETSAEGSEKAEGEASESKE